MCKGGICEWVDALAYGKRRRDGRGRRERIEYIHWIHGCSKVAFKIQYIQCTCILLMNVAGQMLNLYLLVCDVEEGDVPDGENVLIELHQLGKNLMIEGRRKAGGGSGGEQREEANSGRERERRRCKRNKKRKVEEKKGEGNRKTA